MAAAAATALCAGFAADRLQAQDAPLPREGQWYVSPMVSGVFDDKDRASDPGIGGSFGIGYQFAPHWAAELNLLGTHLDGYNEVNQLGAGLDFIGMGDTSRRAFPYGLVGLNYMRTNVAEPPNATPGRDDDDMAFNWGLGFMARMGDSNALFRMDARHRYTFSDPDELSDILVNIGFVFPFGGAQPVAAPVDGDSDGDGVPDSRDRCPGTAPGRQVDSNGCELPQDSDGDGVTDDKDRCPNTPSGTRVGPDGCELDSDGDGVTDDKDACPDTPAGVRVDFRGCEIREEIALPNVNFEFDSDVLTPDSTETLDGAVATLNRYPELTVECSGHTDSVGSESYNEDLSRRRAHSVCEYLKSHGIDASRLTERGYGESRPIADNDTEEGRAQNRRVTLRITGGA
jgi:OOP family OmpA-OmpF porin